MLLWPLRSICHDAPRLTLRRFVLRHPAVLSGGVAVVRVSILCCCSDPAPSLQVSQHMRTRIDTRTHTDIHAHTDIHVHAHIHSHTEDTQIYNTFTHSQTNIRTRTHAHTDFTAIDGHMLCLSSIQFAGVIDTHPLIIVTDCWR